MFVSLLKSILWRTKDLLKRWFSELEDNTDASFREGGVVGHLELRNDSQDLLFLGTSVKEEESSSPSIMRRIVLSMLSKLQPICFLIPFLDGAFFPRSCWYLRRNDMVLFIDGLPYQIGTVLRNCLLSYEIHKRCVKVFAVIPAYRQKSCFPAILWYSWWKL